MTNNSIFTRVLSLVLCVIMFAGVLTSCLQMPEFKPTLGTHNHTTPNAGTTTGDHVDNEPTDDPIVPDEPVDPNELYSGSTTLANSDLIYGSLANDVFIGGEEGVAAMIPADVKVEAGASSLALSIKKVEDETLADTLSNLDVHISGIALDNTVPMTVMLGAILPAGLGLTELKLYHIENGTPVLMTRVNSATDFAIHNQYVYDAETGNVTIYVSSFSVFTAVQTTADVWDGEATDTSWYNENDTEFTLTTVEQFIGFRDLVDEGNTFEGKTVKLGVDIDLANVPFDPIGFGYWYEKNVVEGKDQNTVFMGTFDGGNHTIYNLYENCWELDPDKTNYSTYTYSTAGAGLFASIKNSTIKNLAISGAEVVFECVDMGVLVGYAQGECHFENIVITNANIANYNRYTGGVVGEVSYGPYGIDKSLGYSHTFKNITVDSSVTVSGLWGSFGCGMGGVIGGKWGDATVLMENVVSAPVMDVYNDVVSAYQWYAFRGCGMLVGHTEEPYSDGRHSGIASASFLTCENVKVYYGDWVNYTYYEFENQDNATGRNYPWVRAEAGEYCDAFSNIRYGVPTHNGIKVSDLTEEELKAVATDYTPIIFNQLYGADRGMYGQEAHEGVTVIKTNTKTIYIENNLGWENLKLHYWYKHGDDTWTNHDADGIDMSKMLVEYGIYKVSLPAYAYGFIIVASEGASEEFILSELTEDTRYTLGAEKAPGVSIGGTTYPTLQEALNKVKDGETITLNTDVTLTTPLTVSGGVSITLDLAGKTIIANYEGKVIDNKSIVEVLLVNGANVTIKNGTMIANGDGEYVQVISAINGATVTIENGTFTSTGCTAIYATTGATVTINGGHFNAETPYEEDGRYYTLDVNEELTGDERGTIVVNGGTFENFNPANHTTDGKDYTNKLADGLHATQNGTTYTVEAHTAGTIVVEKETASSCTATGSYDNVVYCTGCNAELSRETVTVDAKGHTPSTEADCENAQTCTVCGVVITPALGHTPGAEADCENAQTCTVCGTTLVGAIGHNYETVVTKPTCTEGGYTTYTCSCGHSYVGNETEANGHNWSDATCTTPKTCSTCGATEGTALGHSYDNACDTDCNTCGTTREVGEHTYDNACDTTCNICGAARTIEHTPGAEANCENAQTCTVCGAEITPALGHTPGAEATCTTAQTCTTCGTELVGARGHNLIDVEGQSADCLNAGYTAYKDCSNCDYIEGKKVIPATGHTHIAGVCSCGDDIRETITIDFSKENISNEADANDLAFGNFYINASKGTHTNNSPKYYTSDHSVRIYVGNTLTITSEKFVILNITFTTVSANYSLNNATFTSGTATTTENVTVLTGIYSNFLTLTNANSGNTQMRIVKMVITYYVGEPCEHDAGSEEINVEPTCTENGYTATKCTDCRAEISRIEGEAATGHSYNGVETTAPTCTTTGVMTYTCSACDDSYTEEIAALGHTTETGICDNCREQIGGTIEPDPDPETPNKTIVSMDIFANKGSLVNKVITWTSGGVTVSNAQGSTAIRTEDADHFRVYANSTVTISVNGGKITQVAITCTSNAYATVMETSATNAGYTVTVSGSVVTITVDNADSITFKASAQTRISKVEVTYTAGDESGETECTHANATNEVTRQATCVATGEITYTCECGEEWTEEIPATGEHTYENGTCTSCGADDPNAGGSTPAEPTTLATFELGTATTDSNSATSTYKEEDGDYTLSITGSKMYTGYGNNQSGLKFGSSSAKGSAEFTVSGNITKVVIYVCKYSSDSTKITVNGTEYTLTSEYQAIEIKQPTENTEWKVSIEAVNASKNRFYMHQIEFIGYAE